MKYYVILIVTYLDDTSDKVAIYNYATQSEAIQAFYANMGRYINGENVATVCVEAKNNVGGVYKNEFWTAPLPEPQPMIIDEPEE